jgi:hypothetical protein
MITQKDVTSGRIRVRVGERTGRFVRFLTANGNPMGGVLVLLDQGNVQSAYENDGTVTLIEGHDALVKVTPWEQVGPDDWVCFFEGLTRTAGRADSAGWIAYGFETGHTNGRCTSIEDGKKQARDALAKTNIDVSALNENDKPAKK